MFDYRVVFLKCRVLGRNGHLRAFLDQKRAFRTFFESKHVILGHFGSKKVIFDVFSHLKPF